MRRDVALAGVAALAAIYEFVAILTNDVPTITEALETLPELIELAAIVALVVWLLVHFEWIRQEPDDTD